MGAFTPKLLTTWREGYTLARLKDDALAGLTVAIVALPLAMALGIASGASPDKGLVTAIVAGFLISALGGSRVQIGGPTGAFVVIISGIIATHGYSGLMLATMLAGLILIVAGYAGVGRLMKFIPTPVITGFTAGIAVIIASSQIADFLGLNAEGIPADFLGKWAAYGQAIGTANLAALGIGIVALATILLLKRVAPRWPGYLIALALTSLAALALHLPVETVGLRFPDMPTGLPAPRLPAFSMAMLGDVIGPAFTIAFLAGIEALLSATVADGMTGYRHRSGQELVGQGAANLASALFGGLPATGAIARTATNIRAGGKTPLAGIFHAAFLLLFLLIAGPLIAYIPMAALAAVLLIVAWGMSEIDRFRALMRLHVGERVLLLLTFALTVTVDLTVAIGVGVTLASLLFMARMSEAAGLLPDEAVEEGEGEDPGQRATLPPGVEVFRLAGPLFFGAAGEMLDALTRIGRTPDTVILRLGRVPYIDASGIMMLESFVRQARDAGTRVILCPSSEHLAQLAA
ncbi:sodium-independent anion transporter [Sphingobium jiangsuense]|uniref:SulP family sulfate permease n=1 Tax=Sphingobium jiangsuense TaxID=870476 RepID=A0A7W6BL50_9SPHN|nr:SulP family inorganic anion transporter [Sphingobium jiangsuense]MBB3928953.1 SulP family sulfate permease [Sphingobium jiangsuense]GLT02991.1 sodium-independent anion transporter [Sphingobium jiangsuense]